MEKKIINSEAAPTPIGPYNHSVEYNNLLFVSGQIPFNQANGELVNSGIQDETEMVMQNLKAILEKAGYNFSHVLKCTIFLTDMLQFSAVNEVYARYFTPTTAPARECVQVAALPRGVNVEISLIAGK